MSKRKLESEETVPSEQGSHENEFSEIFFYEVSRFFLQILRKKLFTKILFHVAKTKPTTRSVLVRPLHDTASETLIIDASEALQPPSQAVAVDKPKKKYIAIPKAVKNEIRQMINSGMTKAEVENKLRSENKIESEIHQKQWSRLRASRANPEEALPTQQFRTVRNKSTEGFKIECLQILRSLSSSQVPDVNMLQHVCKHVKNLPKYATNVEVQKLSMSRNFARKLAKNSDLLVASQPISTESTDSVSELSIFSGVGFLHFLPTGYCFFLILVLYDTRT